MEPFCAAGDLRSILELSGLTITYVQGVAFDPLHWEWRLSSDIGVNYMVAAVKPRMLEC